MVRGGGTWCYNADTNNREDGPKIGRNSIDAWFPSSYDHRDSIPLVRWINPLTKSVNVRIKGTVSLYVRAMDAYASSVDWIVARKSGSAWTTIAGDNFAFSAGNGTHVDYGVIGEVSWTGRIEPGDDIVISVRTADGPTSDGWCYLYDNLTFTIVPIGTMALIR